MYILHLALKTIERTTAIRGWLRCTVVERLSLAGELSYVSHARLAADGWPLLWVNHPLPVSQPLQVSLSPSIIKQWVGIGCVVLCIRLASSGEIYGGGHWPGGRKVMAACLAPGGWLKVTCGLTAYIAYTAQRSVTSMGELYLFYCHNLTK